MYLLKIRLLDVEPEIWRRFVVPASITLDRLHDIIQIVMGCKAKLPVLMVQEHVLLKMLTVLPAILTFTVFLLIPGMKIMND